MCRGCCASFIAHAPDPARSQDLSASANYVVARIRGGPQSARTGAYARRPQAVCGQPARRHDQRDRHAHQSRGFDHCAGRAQDGLRRCATASRRSIPRATRSRGRSAAPIATSIPPSTASPGIWSRTASAATSWTTAASKIVKDTEPYKWNGGNPNMPTECGPRTEKYFWRSENYDDLTLDRSGRLHPQPAAAAQSLAAARRRTDAGAGARQGALRARGGQVRQADSARGIAAPIATAGPKARARNLRRGNAKPTDNTGLLDTPQLTNIALTAPICTTARRARSKRSGPSSTPKTSTGAPTT